MGRIVVLLTFACLIGTFVFLYNSNNKPTQNATSNNSNESKQSNSQSTKLSHSSKSSQDRASDRVSNKAAKPRHASKDIKTEPNQTVNIATTVPEDNEDASQPKVKDESAPLYWLNSQNSHVLRRLKRGEKLKADVGVIDSEGRWSIVKGQGDSKSGFVRDENLEKPSKGVTAGKPKPAQDQ